MTHVHAYAAREAGGRLTEYEYELGDIGPDQVDIRVESCGLCHSDLTILDNEGGFTPYPLVPGHEVVGTIVSIGSHVRNLHPGMRVGLGWFSGSCMHCRHCMSGDQNLCDTIELTIVGRQGGFADLVRCNEEWAVPLPDSLDAKDAGPLFCGGVTVLNPLIQYDVRPTQRVGVIGIGGLGHLALQFLNKWGCEVTAFTTSSGKGDELKRLGAHNVVNSTDGGAMKSLASRFDFILNTTNAALDWQSYFATLAPRGRFHTVGILFAPIEVPTLPLILGQKSLSGSPLGSPETLRQMLEFCARHGIKPVTEHFKMSDVNAAFDHLRAGKARYRIVLDN
jgi:uncharacterized zinc-type alcohol dehydrogenase-like protein